MFRHSGHPPPALIGNQKNALLLGPAAGAVCRWVLLVVVVFRCLSGPPWLRLLCSDAGQADWLRLLLCVWTQRDTVSNMAIVGEVQVKKMRCIQQLTQDNVASQRADVTLFWKSPFGEPESRFVVDRARF